MQHSGDCPASLGPMPCSCGATRTPAIFDEAQVTATLSVFLPRIVGFAGLRRSGKDTAAAALIEDGYERVSFAGPLKAMLRTLLGAQGLDDGTIGRMIEGELKEVATPYLNGRSPRHAMQTLGTEWGRDLMHTDLWVRSAMRAAATKANAVFTDVRFANEVDAIRAVGGRVLKIVRPSLEADAHASEALVDTLEVDAAILNAGTVADLHHQVRSTLKHLGGVPA